MDRLSAAVNGVRTALVVLALGLVLAAFVIPSGQGSPYSSLDPAAPVRLVIPSLALRAPVVPVAVTQDAVLDPPNDPVQVGWWDASAEPGATSGQTVITGHTVHTGGGAMDAIDTLRPGQRVDVVTSNGTMRYRVTRVRVLDKDLVTQEARGLFGQQGGTGRLVLVSCDDWNGRTYDSNVVVLAEPLGQPVARS